MNRYLLIGRMLLLAACCAATATAKRAFAFGQEGHEAVAILALQKLHADQAANNPRATAALQRITALLGNEEMAAVAVWADWIRLKQTNHVTWAQISDINARFKGNGDWHFVDLPLGTRSYSDTAVSASTNDVVHGIYQCIALLESADTSAQQDRHLVALKFLIHLAGDIHQPLHVACGYYHTNKSAIVRSPSKARGLPDDRGGNQLKSTVSSNSASLHHLWDSDLVFAQTSLPVSNVEGSDVAAALSGDLTPNLFPAETGDHHNWPAAWATDSIKASVAAYKGVKVPVITTLSHGGSEIGDTSMKKFKKTAYIAAHDAAAKQQLLKAAWRLAEMLENISWHN
jgi:hypothetical protein